MGLRLTMRLAEAPGSTGRSEPAETRLNPQGTRFDSEPDRVRMHREVRHTV